MFVVFLALVLYPVAYSWVTEKRLEKQGKLSAMSKTLFARQDALDRASLMTYAAELKLDVDRFRADLDAPETEARLEEDEALAAKFEVRGTPTSFVEGRRVVGAQPLARFTE